MPPGRCIDCACILDFHLTDKPRPNLRRTFAPASPEGDEDKELHRYLLQRQGKAHDWDWLLASRIIVILDEAGAGKTAELQDQIRRLPSDTQGFFLRIERLCTQSLAKAFESEADQARFDAWRRSKQQAVIFLDSVDEAKLPMDLDRNPLQTAIRAVDGVLGTELARVRFVISSRGSAWNREPELAEVRRLSHRFRAAGVKAVGDAPIERFVRLDPLSPEQIRTLAAWASAPDGFLDALFGSGSLDFAETPLDLLDLIASFRGKVEAGEAGDVIFRSLSALTENAIRRRATERGSERARNHLPLERTRQGARRLAAACVLGQTLTISLPGLGGEGLDPVGALEGAGSGWSRAEIDQLLVCGLFTAGWEGSVRFQHRRTMERLAAEAFDDLLRAGMTVTALAGELMPEGFGAVTVPAPYVQVLGWLASLNDDFRRFVVRHAPQLLIDTGDPGAHPILTRIEALRRHAHRYEGGIWRSEWFEHRMLRRFSDPALADVCLELLRTAPAEEPKRMLLDLARLAGFDSSLPAVLEIVEDVEASPGLRADAVDVAFALAGPAALASVRAAALRFRPQPRSDNHIRRDNNRFRLAVAGAGRRNGLGLADALAVLCRLEPTGKNWASVHDHGWAEAFAASVPADRLSWLMRWLSRFSWPAKARIFGSFDPPGWTPAGLYLLPMLEAVVLRLIEARPDQHEDPLLVVNVDRLHAVGEVSLGPLRRDDEAEGRERLSLAVRGAVQLRRAIFGMAVRRGPKGGGDAPGDLIERLKHHHDPMWVRFTEGDLDWMAEAYAATTSEAERAALVEAIRQRLWSLPKAERGRGIHRFTSLAKDRDDPGAAREFQPPRFRSARQWWWRNQRRLTRWRRQKVIRDLKSVWARKRLSLKLQLNRARVRSGEASGLLWWAIFSERMNEDDLDHLAERYSVAWAGDLVAGAKAFAQSYEPPATGRPYRAIQLATAGWSRIALDSPDIMETLSEPLARRALTVGVRANSLPAWVPTLAERHPSVWSALTLPHALEEVRWSGAPLIYASGLSLISRQSDALRLLMAKPVLDALAQTTVPDPAVIAPGAAIVRGAPDLEPALAVLAERRFWAFVGEGSLGVAASWFLVWFEAAPEPAWRGLRRFQAAYGSGSARAAHDILCLLGDAVLIPGLSAKLLADMAVDYMQWILIEEDDDDSGSRPRSDAERVRSQLPTQLAEHTTDAARAVLLQLAAHPVFAPHGGWMTRVLERQAAAAAAPRRWSGSEVVGLMSTFLRPPATADELHALVQRHLKAILTDLQGSEFDRRGLFRGARELDARAFFAHALETRSQGWFSVTQETVTAREKRTDLRIEGRAANGDPTVVIVEIKLATPAVWPKGSIVERIETQLVDQYLISRKVRHGVYLVVEIGDPTVWTIDGAVLDFDALCSRLRARALELSQRSDIDGLTVVAGRIALPDAKGCRTPAKARKSADQTPA